MITPAFEIQQDLDFLTITIKVPYARVSDFDIYIEGDEFKFYAKPYFLRLNLPGRIVEDGSQKATYNIDEGIFTVCIAKETPGQHFEGLDLLTSLLAPKGSRSSKPLVEEIGSSNENPEEDEEEEFDWQIEQTPFEEPSADVTNSQCTYGFGNLRTGVFRRLQEELNDVIDLRDPDVTPASERTHRRLAAEKAKFDPDHYLADLFEDESIHKLLKYQPWWVAASTGASSASVDSQEKTVTFSEKEKEQLRKFTNKSHLLDKKSHQLAFLGLIDLLLAYCYEVRVTEGERNVESAWNIRKLSGTLSWFETFTSIKDVLVSFGRRVVCYPLYRHFSLVTKAIKDTNILLKLGKAAILKCLLEIHAIFQENDPAYILNDLYITDYCIWIQRVKSKKVSALSDSMQLVSVSKADLGFELQELEEAARLVQEEHQQLASDAGPLNSITESSSSESSTETDDSTSDEDESSSSEELESDESDNDPLSGKSFVEEVCVIQNAGCTAGISEESEQPPPVPLQEVENIIDKMNTAIILSEPLPGQAAASDNAQDNKEACCAVQLTDSTEGRNRAREFLEVTPRKNPLIIVPQSDEDKMLTEH
ncbi:protein SHQ1 homolog [Rhinophrynus dorsalis]